MRSDSRLKVAVLGGSLCMLMSAGFSFGQTANGLYIQPRYYNDYPNSTETVTINGSPMVNPTGTISSPGLPAAVTINDVGFANNPASGFANRDNILISADHGNSIYTGDINQGFSLSANVTLSDGLDTPRKEAGLRIDSSVSGDALFILDSDSGEIVAFGGGAPFYSFRPNIESKYVTGQTIFMKEVYTPGVGGTTMSNPGTIEYFAQLLSGPGVTSPGPLLDSGPLLYSNNEGGPTLPQIGFYDQAPDGQSTSADFVTASFNNINAAVPEPATMSILAMGAVTLLSRRRANRAV